MLVHLNGQLVPEDQAMVSVFDRGFLYGDGLFETVLLRNGCPFRWEQHLQRLERGAAFLKIMLPFAPEQLRDFLDELVTENRLPQAIVRLTLTRGIGPRGYSPVGADQPSLVMSLHPAPVVDLRQPPRWRLVTASPRLVPNDPLAAYKTCNKLSQILARAEAEAAHAQEALLLNTDGQVVEAASSNLFWIENGTVFTPPLASGILPGVTRGVVLELSQRFGLPAKPGQITPNQLRQAEGVFLSLSTLGIAEAIALDGHSLAQSPLTAKLQAGYAELLRAETTPRP